MRTIVLSCLLFASVVLVTALSPGFAIAQILIDSEPEPSIDLTPLDEEATSGVSSQRETIDDAPREAGVSLIEPFGQNLFNGNFAAERRLGVNPDYIVATGDRVIVRTWGSVTINDVFTVDGQGNIFLPEVGPVKLAGVPNDGLTSRVERALKRVYRNGFGVYTDLVSPQPVGVFVAGFARNPGRYAGLPTDSLLFFLDRAGGIDPDLGSYRHVSILRGTQVLAEIDLYDFLLQGRLPAFQFRDGDTILVAKRGPVIILEGSIARPALVEMSAKEILGHEVLDVVPESALATEVTLVGLRDSRPFNRTYSLKEFREVELRNGDRVELRDEGNADRILVRLEGEFDGPSVLAVRRGTQLLDLLDHVPIHPELANGNAIHILRESVRESQKQAIEDSLFRLERSTLLALSDSTGEVGIRRAEAELVKSFVSRAREIEPLGRIVTAVSGQQRNILLEDGDVVVIPRRTNIVQVGGEVLIAQAVLHREDKTPEDYVDLVGGYTDRSDQGNFIVIHQSGEISRDEDAEILPGDQILVMPRIDSKEVQNALDFTQIISRIVLSAGVLLAL